MSVRFTPCPACARHVKLSDSMCPFCGKHVPHVNAPAARLAVGRLSRSALFAAGAAGLGLTADCGSMGTDYGNPCTTANGSDTCILLVEDASADAADAGSLTPSNATAEAGPTEGGSDGAVVPPTDGSGG